MATDYSALVYAVEEQPSAWGGMLEQKLGGKAVLNHSIDVFEEDPGCVEILVLADAGVREWITGNPLEFASGKMRVLQAQPTRALSLYAAAQEARQPLLVVHDALRPNFGADLLARVLATSKPGLGVAPVWQAGEPLAELVPLAGSDAKVADMTALGPKADHRKGQLQAVPQAQLSVVQTPQAFYRDDYIKTAADTSDPTGGALVCIAAGLPVVGVLGRLENLRLDSEHELRVLQKLMGTGPKKKEKYTGLGW